MTVSSNTSFNPAAVKIITSAYRKLGIINEDETPTAGQFEVGMFGLNSLMKEWMASGIHIWTEEEAVLFLQKDQRCYLLGGTTTDHCADASAWQLSTLAQNSAAGATTFVLTGTIGAAAGDNFGVVDNNGRAQWSTIQSVTGTTVRLNTAISVACSSGAFTFNYAPSVAILRPLRVPYCRRLQYALPPNYGVSDEGGIITPLAPMMSRQEYFNLPQPNNPGLVTQAYYNPARDQGEMWVWNVSQTANFGLRFTYYRPLHDFTTGANTADLPQEWANTLTWNLAKEIGPDYSVAAVRWDRIVAQADAKLEMVRGWDRESESVYFGRASSQSRGG